MPARAVKTRAFGTAGFVADGDHKIILKTLSMQIKNAARLILRYIQSNFAHHISSRWQNRFWIQAGTFGLETVAAFDFDQCLSHLAAGTIMAAYKQHPGFGIHASIESER